MKIRLNNCTINYAERGVPQGVPVVFVHGFPFDHTMWEPQMKSLPNHFRAITYDIRGHGQSDVGDGQFTIELFVDDLIALLDHLVVQQTIICGLSMGGYIALRAYERHRERFTALVLADTKSGADTNEARLKRAATLKTVKQDGVEVFADGFEKLIFAPRSFQTHPEVVESVRRTICGYSPLGIAGAALALGIRTDTTHVLRAMASPVADGSRVPLATETVYREGEAPGNKSAAKIGGAAIGGAVLGAIFGGGKGDAIGGSIGAAGGTAAVMAGDRKPGTLPAGTTVTVRLSGPATVTVER